VAGLELLRSSHQRPPAQGGGVRRLRRERGDLPGRAGQKDTCKYVFKIAGKKEEDSFVQVYAPATKEVPSSPNDPFFKWKKVGKVFVTEKAMSPKSAPLLAASTGLWLPGNGYVVSINASTNVCTKPEAERLAKSLH
jgi:hypothetical protein